MGGGGGGANVHTRNKLWGQMSGLHFQLGGGGGRNVHIDIIIIIFFWTANVLVANALGSLISLSEVSVQDSKQEATQYALLVYQFMPRGLFYLMLWKVLF